MATHSSVLTWRIPGTAEPGGQPSMGLHRVGHDWSDSAVAAVVFHYVYTTSSLVIHLLMDIQVLSMSWLLYIVLLWTQGCIHRFELQFCPHIYMPGVWSPPSAWFLFLSLIPSPSLAWVTHSSLLLSFCLCCTWCYFSGDFNAWSWHEEQASTFSFWFRLRAKLQMGSPNVGWI